MLRRTIAAVLALLMLSSPLLRRASLAESYDSWLRTDVDDPAAEAEAAQAADGQEEVYGSDDHASISIFPTLRLGDRDDDEGIAYIVFMQNKLIELGYLDDAADGVYGANTESAVSAFQQNNGLQATGIADPGTLELLYYGNDLKRATLDPSLAGNETYRVQFALAQWGFLKSKADGKFGKDTASAIRLFQNYMRAVDPKFGSLPTPVPTATPEPISVFEDMPVAVDELLDPTMAVDIIDGEIDQALLAYVNGEVEFPYFHETVMNGFTGMDVSRVQYRLHYLNYLHNPDGTFGSLTEYALRYFQQKNDLLETGIADEATQRKLFSADAVPSEEYVFPYKLLVDISSQRVYAGQWTGSGYTQLVRTMKCSTGTKETPTPTGTYQCDGRAGGEWYHFEKLRCYAKWAYRIVGGIMFHSVIYDEKGKLIKSTVKCLGRKASHGCIRLSVDDAKWIYEHCPTGTTVVIRE